MFFFLMSLFTFLPFMPLQGDSCLCTSTGTFDMLLGRQGKHRGFMPDLGIHIERTQLGRLMGGLQQNSANMVSSKTLRVMSSALQIMRLRCLHSCELSAMLTRQASGQGNFEVLYCKFVPK